MYTKVITYSDYNGEDRKETFHFNLNKKELADLNFEVEGGLEYYINRISETKNPKQLVELVTVIIDKSYGIKSPDGISFRKSKEILEDFKSKEAYSELYIELLSDADKLLEFIQGITAAATKGINLNTKIPPQLGTN